MTSRVSMKDLISATAMKELESIVTLVEIDFLKHRK
jgi:hypothetical protein